MPNQFNPIKVSPTGPQCAKPASCAPIVAAAYIQQPYCPGTRPC